jgi:hypothetical protein
MTLVNSLMFGNNNVLTTIFQGDFANKAKKDIFLRVECLGTIEQHKKGRPSFLLTPLDRMARNKI